MARTLDAIDLEIREVKGRTFKHLGDLLIEIVDRKLYQDRGFTNVEDYFQSERNLPSARQAFRLISATRFCRQLPASVPQPKNERQVRPLLGRKRDEARLLWTMATLVAHERRCALDGKLVATVAKEFDEGLLREWVPEACDLLGDAAPTYPAVPVTASKRSPYVSVEATETDSEYTPSPKRAKKRSLNKDPAPVHNGKLDAELLRARKLAVQLSVAVGQVLCLVVGEPVQKPNKATKRPRQSPFGVEDALELTQVLKQTLTNVVKLPSLMLSQSTAGPLPSCPTTTDPASHLDVEDLEMPARNPAGKAGSSEDELSVAEALLTMSHLPADA